MASAWVDALARARQKWWQVLPLGPTSFGDSPYQSPCSFAGNPNLISPDLLVRDGLLEQDDLASAAFPLGSVDYNRVIPFKQALLTKAWDTYQADPPEELAADLEAFCAAQASWLVDFTLFLALKEAHQGATWIDWAPEYVKREPAALAAARQQLRGPIEYHQFVQFLFFRQWQDLRKHARDRGIRLMGDLPIYVSADSSDVWADPDLFFLDDERRPSVVAGVPPDYFSATGQLWGNPLYNWKAHRETNFAWWVRRLRATLALVDVVRLDHFRGFEAYWEVPADATTAATGQWVPGPGDAFFTAVRQQLGGLPLVAEDLGLITPEVEALRERHGLPGMRVLQFAFSDPNNRYLPHNYDAHTIVYTGTHDNDTTRGWYAALNGHESAFLRRYAPHIGGDISWDLIRLAWSSVAQLAIAPLQDVLSLGSEARMNSPGKPIGNWGWRIGENQFTEAVVHRLADLSELYRRV
jgi:4-alpha-glucanotransferase